VLLLFLLLFYILLLHEKANKDDTSIGASKPSTNFVTGIPLFTSFAQQYMSDSMSLLFLGLALGALIMFLFWKLNNRNKSVQVRESSHTVIESMRKVFKLVLAEGVFNELYNFEETKKLFRIIPTSKRALVIIQAKVLIGFDFEKCTWEVDENNQKIRLVSFPEPEIVSIETDYKYYNLEEGVFNLIGREDFTRIQANGKKQVEQAALKSDLPRMAADQMRTLLTEVVQSKNWQIENLYRISGSGAAGISHPGAA
jgi:hypothetical protein